MILKFIKSLFQKTIVDEGQVNRNHKSLNAAILTDIINQNNLRNRAESNDNN